MPVNSTRGGGSAKAFGLIAGGKKFIIATGGTETTSGDYKIHTFTGPGTFTVSQAGSVGKTDTVDYLVIAGGAGCPPGPGRPSQVGGSGAGGYRESKSPTAPWTASPLASSTSIPVSITGYPISVGGGGTDSAGTPSVFSTITSAGGGKGGIFQGTAVAGGSGGGGGGNFGGTRPGAAGNTPPTSPPQGNSGAPGAGPDGNGSGGGGGGAGAAGNFINNRTAGPGGSGIGTAINTAVGTTDGPNPALRYFGGGGCGGSGGAGPGGTGGYGGGGPPGTAGTANTGGGGGAPGGGGGSGIVVIRYLYK